MNDSSAKSPSTTNQVIIRLVIGLLFLLPAVILYRANKIQPAIETLEMSYQEVDVLARNEPQDIGAANYEKLTEDATFIQATGYTFLIVFVRLLIVAIVPPLVGLLIGGQRRQGRLFNRFLLAGLSVLISPVILGLLWSVFTAQAWGRETSPLWPLPGWMSLNSVEGARTSLIFVDALVTLGIAAVVGGTAFAAVTRGRAVSMSHGFAGIGVWIMGILLTLASLPQTFELPFLLTRGGPARSTTTVPLSVYDNAFTRFNLGYGAAQASIIIVLVVMVALLIWAVLAGFRLRLMFTPPSEPSENTGLLSVLSVLLLVVIGFPILGLVLWGLWLASTTQGFADVGSAMNFTQTFLNTISGSWSTIWFVQIPITYLAGLSLGFLRPINRIVSQLLFLVFLVFAFIPAESLLISWYMAGRENGEINTLMITGVAWMTGPFSLIMFKMFFDGAFEKFRAARESGQTNQESFVNVVFLPSLSIVILVGAVLSFASLHSFLWSLIVTNDQSLYSMPLQLLMMRTQGPMTSGAFLGAALSFIGITAILFIPLFALLHVFVLDRLSIVAGRPVDLELIAPEKRKHKRNELSS